LGHRSATVIVEFGSTGRLEVTLASGGNVHRVELERGSRLGRAVISSPSLGDYEFEVGSGSSSGIIVLTTSKGLHKVTNLKIFSKASLNNDWISYLKGVLWCQVHFLQHIWSWYSLGESMVE